MTGKKGHSGGHRAEAGRNRTSLRHLEAAIKNTTTMFSPGMVGDIRLDLSLQYCAYCGAWGWEKGAATIWGLEFGEAGVEPLATTPINGQELKHNKSCKNQ